MSVKLLKYCCSNWRITFDYCRWMHPLSLLCGFFFPFLSYYVTHRDLLACDSRVLELKLCATMPGSACLSKLHILWHPHKRETLSCKHTPLSLLSHSNLEYFPTVTKTPWSRSVILSDCPGPWSFLDSDSRHESGPQSSWWLQNWLWKSIITQGTLSCQRKLNPNCHN